VIRRSTGGASQAGRTRAALWYVAGVRRLRVLLSCLALSAAAPLVGCAAPQVSIAEGPREYVATDYESVLRQWTRTERLFALSELDNFLTATATFESWDFRWAYVVRYVQDYRLTIDERKKLLEKTLDETRRRHQFFVALYGGERRFNDLTKPDSAWIVRLIDDTGNETAPEEIQAIRKPNALERTYFPYNTVFRMAFRIRFPRFTADGRSTISTKAKWFGLRFAGAQGNTQLVWELEPPEGEAPKDAPGTAPTPLPSAPAPAGTTALR
jgi:hypothetical protein